MQNPTVHVASIVPTRIGFDFATFKQKLREFVTNEAPRPSEYTSIIEQHEPDIRSALRVDPLDFYSQQVLPLAPSTLRQFLTGFFNTTPHDRFKPAYEQLREEQAQEALAYLDKLQKDIHSRGYSTDQNIQFRPQLRSVLGVAIRAYNLPPDSKLADLARAMGLVNFKALMEDVERVYLIFGNVERYTIPKEEEKAVEARYKSYQRTQQEAMREQDQKDDEQLFKRDLLQAKELETDEGKEIIYTFMAAGLRSNKEDAGKTRSLIDSGYSPYPFGRSPSWELANHGLRKVWDFLHQQGMDSSQFAGATSRTKEALSDSGYKQFEKIQDTHDLGLLDVRPDLKIQIVLAKRRHGVEGGDLLDLARAMGGDNFDNLVTKLEKTCPELRKPTARPAAAAAAAAAAASRDPSQPYVATASTGFAVKGKESDASVERSAFGQARLRVAKEEEEEAGAGHVKQKAAAEQSESLLDRLSSWFNPKK